MYPLTPNIAKKYDLHNFRYVSDDIRLNQTREHLPKNMIDTNSYNNCKHFYTKEEYTNTEGVFKLFDENKSKEVKITVF